MSRFPNASRWLGVGFKSGGQLGIGGVESTTAKLWCLQDGESFDLEIISGRWGLGLGGSGGFVVVFGFGFTVAEELHREPANDWGVNIAFTEKLISKSMISSFQFALLEMKMARATGILKLAPSTLEQLRNLGHTIFGGLEVAKHSGVVVIDLPFAGIGLEVSAYVTRGTMYVSNSTDWIEPN